MIIFVSLCGTVFPCSHSGAEYTPRQESADAGPLDWLWNKDFFRAGQETPFSGPGAAAPTETIGSEKAYIQKTIFRADLFYYVFDGNASKNGQYHLVFVTK